MRGVREGWFPEIAAPDVPSETIYGTCADIRENTTDAMEVVHTYPWGDPAYWRGPLVNQSDIIKAPKDGSGSKHVRPEHHYFSSTGSQIAMVAVFFLLFIGIKTFSGRRNSKKWEYTEIQT